MIFVFSVTAQQKVYIEEKNNCVKKEIQPKLS